MYNGSCMCGAVSYSFKTELPDYGVCHCVTCQKASGAAFTANIPISRADLSLSGEESIREYESSPGKLRCFCANCGSPIYAYLKSSPDMLRIRIGSLDTEIDKAPNCHFFTKDRATWFEKSKDAREFETWPDRDFLVLKGSKQSEKPAEG